MKGIEFLLNQQYTSMWEEVLEAWANRNYQQPIFSPMPVVVREYTANLQSYLTKEYTQGEVYDHQDMCYPSRWRRSYQSIYSLSISLLGTSTYCARITYQNGVESLMGHDGNVLGRTGGIYQVATVDYGDNHSHTFLPWQFTSTVEGIVDILHKQREHYIHAMNVLKQCPECHYYSEAGNRLEGRALLGYCGRGLLASGDCGGYREYKEIVR